MVLVVLDRAGVERAPNIRGGSHSACAPNLALCPKIDGRKGALTALRVGGEGGGQLLLLSYADTQYV